MSETSPFAITVPLPADLPAARALCSDLGLRPGHTLKACHEALLWLGESMKLISDPPKPDYEDQFAPKRGGKRQLKCAHCEEVYPESKAQYRYKIGHTMAALWWCPTPRCDGAGVGFDLHPVDS